MARGIRANQAHATPLMAVLVAMALSVPHARAHAHATTNPPFERRGGKSRGGAVAPAPAPLIGVPVDGHGDGNGMIAAWVGRAMYELAALCHARGWVLAPSDADDDRYVVTTGTSAAVADQKEEERDREGEGKGRCR